MTTGQAAHAERLREFGATEHNQLGNAAEAGAAALDEVATLRAARDEWRNAYQGTDHAVMAQEWQAERESNADTLATLRATIDWLDCTRRELGDMRHCRLDARCQRCELDTLRAERDNMRERLSTCQEGHMAYQHAAERQLGELRARVQQLEQALAGHATECRPQDAVVRAALGTTPPETP